MTIRGAGGGGGGGSQRAPVESPDSLVSIAYARIVDLICEGEIFGLVNGAESVFLDGTPLESNGVPNFGSVTYDTRQGTQDQTYIPGFAQVESEISVGAEVTTAIPYTRTITNTDLSALRLNLNVPRMARQNTENGDLTGATVMYGIDLAIGSGAFSRIKTTSFNGKTTGGYNRSERVDLPPGSPDGWRVRIVRITPDSSTSNLADAFYVSSVTEIIDAKFRYPNSALVATQFDAEVFGGKIPVRSFDMWGRYMRVPSNYDTELRTYDGIWDGTFKVAEKCNNPAWVYYDLLLNDFFGLGERISADQVDKWSLYQIAQYCDQMVDDGLGGLEPRFTLNIYVQQRVDALRLLQDISSVFRGITYCGAGQAYVSADMPSDPVYTYTNANVIGGKFSYKGSKYSTRYSVAHVSWNDPTDSYKTKTEYVENQDAVGRFGIRPVSLAAFGCTSQGQAIRAGKWALLTNLLETETVGFSVGLDGIRARPGQVIRVADNDRAGRRIGGRITAATANTVTLDKVGVIAPGDEITIITPSMESETRTIQSISDKVVTVSPNFSAIPMRMSVFAVDSEELATQLFRIISISESGDMNYPIVAVKHVPGKYDNVDFGTVITTRPITSIPTSSQEPVTNLTAVSEYMIDQYAAVSKMIISWDAPPGAVSYDVEWSRDSSDWIYAGRRSTTEIDVQGIFAGSYMVRVKAINAAGVTSIWTQAGPFELEGKDENTAEVVNLRTVPEIFAIRVRWGVPDIARDTAYTELVYNTTNSDEGATTLGQIAYPTLEYLHSGMGAGVSLWFKARLIDKTGNIGPWSAWVMGTSSVDATAILEYLTGKITETQLGQDLLEEIESIGDMENQLAQLQAQVNEIVGAPDWNDDQVWLEGSLVKFDGVLYRAIQDVPIGTPIENTLYWENIGDYASIGEAVAALAVRMNDAEAAIDEVTGELYSQATDITALRAMSRDDGGEGALADALRGWDAQASFTQEIKVRAEKDRAQASVNTQLEASVGDAYAAVTQTQQVVAGLNGELSAMLSIKVGVRTDGTYYGAGMGIGVENTPAGMQSQVLFLADRFAILHSVEGNAIAPFIVVGGQTIMNNAIIGDATITFAKITDSLQSDNYVANSTGWRLAKNGGLFLNGQVAGQGRTQITNTTYEVFSPGGVRLVRMGTW